MVERFFRALGPHAFGFFIELSQHKSKKKGQYEPASTDPKQDASAPHLEIMATSGRYYRPTPAPRPSRQPTDTLPRPQKEKRAPRDKEEDDDDYQPMLPGPRPKREDDLVYMTPRQPDGSREARILPALTAAAMATDVPIVLQTGHPSPPLLPFSPRMSYQEEACAAHNEIIPCSKCTMLTPGLCQPHGYILPCRLCGTKKPITRPVRSSSFTTSDGFRRHLRRLRRPLIVYRRQRGSPRDLPQELESFRPTPTDDLQQATSSKPDHSTPPGEGAVGRG
jgi:hypothetical protein